MAKLGEMSWKEFKNYVGEDVVVIWPMGPVEEHGPHLPFGVDYICAEEISKKVAEMLEKKNFKIIIAPTLPYTISIDGMSFPGNITLKCETLTAIIRDVCESLANHGVKKIVILCHHLEPENTLCLVNAIESINRELKSINILSIFTIVWEKISRQMHKIIETNLECDLHAGEWETSLMLAIRPDLVKVDEWLRCKPVLIKLLEEKAKGKLFKDIPGGELGYFGNPLKASKEKGEKILQLMAKTATDIIIDFIRKKN